MIGGLVYGFVVFMILPIYASLERMDVSLIEAGKDLYDSSLRTFFTVTVPGDEGRAVRRAWCWSSCRRSATSSAPSCSAVRTTYMIGNLIQQQFFEGQNWPLGVGVDDGDDGRAADLHGRLPAPDRA